ncbi:CHAT domain-containing protein [Microbacterium sp.]|uniref:CHAT domain-containing protein n=1 Tax=Microbacterium sp. TaxID=51671 RepID=UPI003F7075CD
MSTEERAFEVVVLAMSFRRENARADIAEYFPPSVLALYDAVVADPRWDKAATLAEAALVVDDVLNENDDLAAAYQASVDAGEMGFGDGEDAEMDAAMAEVTRMLGDRPARHIDLPTQDLAESAGPDDPSYGSDGLGMAGGGASDGLLGGEEPVRPWEPQMPPTVGGEAGPPPPPVVAPPAPAVPPAVPDAAAPSASGDTIATVLNAELDGDRTRLTTGEKRQLSVFFDESASGAAVASIGVGVPIAASQQTIDLEVQLLSADFTVPPVPQILRLARDGASVNRAIFEITPLHEGASLLSVVVNVKGNFLQRLDMTFDVGTVAEPAVEQFGRPAGAAEVLEKRDATLQFKPVAGGYLLFAPQVTSEPVMIWITPDELEARIEGVRAVLLASVSKEENAFNLDLTEAERDALLKELAFEGFLLYESIFVGSTPSPELAKVAAWLRDELSADVATLQVVSKGFPVPWPLMYLAERFDAAPLSWDNFIGMRHVVEQIPLEWFDQTPPAPTIASAPDLAVRALYNDGIDAQMPSHPVAAQRTYWEGRGVALTEGTTVDELKSAALAPTSTDKVLYLYCHAVAKKDPLDSHLILSGEQSITLGQLRVFASPQDRLPSHPLVFLNACESGELSANFYAGFVPYFLAKGARGVIGTECKTPGLFASEWAKAFFDELFAGKTLGTVVLELRRRFLEQHRNPYGLLYGVQCDVDTVVTPALA